MNEFLQRLEFDRITREQRPLLGEDFVFAAAAFRSVAHFTEVHAELHFEENPLAVVRDIYLQHPDKPHNSLRLTLALALNGFRDALTLLARFAGAFQRAVPEAAVFNTANRDIGDFGVAWAWEGEGEPEIVAFVRNNVFVGLQGHDATEHTLTLTRELDDKLHSLKTTHGYEEHGLGLADVVRQREGGIPRVSAGGRLELGALPEAKKIFFLTSSGSVNRDPTNPSLWYFRGGVEKGPQEVTMFTVGDGILPAKERLTIEVA